MPAIGYGRQSVDEGDVAAVAAVLRGDFLTQGPAVARFEDGLRAATGARHAVAVSSGTAALHVLGLAVGVGPGARVVTSANTFLASATAFVHCGAEVGFADVDPRTGSLDPEALARALGGGARADLVVAVHFAGLPAGMERLLELRRRFGFRLVEDASHALGARWRDASGRWWRPGEHPEVDAAVLSFHPVKHVTTAEGGAMVTVSDDLAARARRLRAHGVDPDADASPFEGEARPAWYAPMVDLGLNYRMSDLHAALGSSQLLKLEGFLARRRALAARYREELSGLPGLALPDPGGEDAEHAWHLFVVRVAGGRRDALHARLRERGIGTQVHYVPVPYHPWFRARLGRADVPRAEEHARSCLSLPLHPSLSDADLDRVVAEVRAWHSELES